jgi:glyoxylase-like metal-dependent hydrolase (beta-lactamase superfamily II)
MKPEKIRIGEYDCWALPDGELTYPGHTLLPAENKPPMEIRVPYTALLVDTGSVKVLVDTGAGALGPATGKLRENLAATGFSPKDVDVMVLSHAHPDHIAGLAQFPNARVTMTLTEFSFWTAEKTEAKLRSAALYGLGPLEQVMADYVRDYLVPERERLQLIDRPTEVAPEVLVFPAPGHTPGHAAVLVSSGRQQLLYIGDALIHLAQLQNPEWTSAFDLTREQTVDTRKALLDRAAADRCILAAFHLPGAIGVLERRRSQFHWEPQFAGLHSPA